MKKCGVQETGLLLGWEGLLYTRNYLHLINPESHFEEKLRHREEKWPLQVYIAGVHTALLHPAKTCGPPQLAECGAPFTGSPHRAASSMPGWGTLACDVCHSAVGFVCVAGFPSPRYSVGKMGNSRWSL